MRCRDRIRRPRSAVKHYIAAVTLTYVPLLICALFMNPLPIATRTATLHLPFLYDWNVAFMFLVSFPSLLALTVRDQHVLSTALRQVQADGTVLVPEAAATALSPLWRKRFRSVNIVAQVL